MTVSWARMEMRRNKTCKKIQAWLKKREEKQNTVTSWKPKELTLPTEPSPHFLLFIDITSAARKGQGRTTSRCKWWNNRGKLSVHISGWLKPTPVWAALRDSASSAPRVDQPWRHDLLRARRGAASSWLPRRGVGAHSTAPLSAAPRQQGRRGPQRAAPWSLPPSPRSTQAWAALWPMA